MNYNVTICNICQRLMNYRQLREGVYWLPDMDSMELSWANYSGFVHNYAHRRCWKQLKEKKRALIRLCAFKGQEPRSMDQKV